MSYSLAGLSSGLTLQQRSASKTKQPVRATRAVVRSHLSPARAAEQACENVTRTAAAISAAALLLVLPANAATPTLLEKGSTYQQELQDLIDKRGSLPPLPSPGSSSEQKKSSGDSAGFKLPNVAKTTLEAPQELAEKALPQALNQLPPPPTPTPDSGTPGQPKASVPKPSLPKPDLPKPDLPKPKLEAPKIDIPKVEAPKPPSLPTPKSSFSGPQEVLPQQPGGGLPTPYLIAGGVAVAGIIGIGLAGASPDRQSPTPPATAAAAKSGGGKPSGGSKPSGGGKASGGKGGLPEGKDPQLDSEVAKKKDPFFKNVKKRS